ncbi:MAG: biopolymer transporter ExbD [Planctomycetes bacterium]|nr:biopolymer transporter ExbD [Planctomycetota bacterium]
MAKKVKEHTIPDSTVDLDMTPMIDMVFQMILFFIIITDFSQKEIALLTLPWSTVGVDDEGEDPGRLVINVTAPVPTGESWPEKKTEQADKIMIKGKYIGFRELYEILRGAGVNNPKYRDPENPRLSTRSVLVRCDCAQAFDYVKGVLQVCASPDIAIYKIEIATAEKQHDDKKPAKSGEEK